MNVNTIQFYLSHIGPTLAAAFNASHVCIGSGMYDSIDAFSEAFNADCFKLASDLGVLRNNSAEDLSVEWNAFKENCVYWTPR